MEKKICTKCGKEKELSEFRISSTIRKDGSKGLRSECKSCEKEYRIKNKDKIREKGKEYQLNNKDKISEKGKEYYNNLKSKELNILNKEFQSFLINNPKYYNKKAEMWTYIIKSDGFYKIGITNRFIGRMKEINKYIPIYEVHRLPINIERRLHLEFEDYRFAYDKQFGGYTELFDITDEMVNEIIKREHFKKVKKVFNTNYLEM